MKPIRFIAMGLLISLLPHTVGARISTPSPTDPDIWCVGTPATETDASTEVCVDSSGDLIPVADDTQDIGSSANEFKDGYFDGTLHADSVSFTGSVTFSSITTSGEIDGDFQINITTVSTPLGSVSVTATSWIGVDRSTISITTVGTDSLVSVEYNCGFAMTNAGVNGWVIAVRDGALIGDQDNDTALIGVTMDTNVNQVSHMYGRIIDSVATAGTYSYSLMARTSANTFYINPSIKNVCTFSVTEVK